MRVNYVMIFVSDMKRSVAFYRDIVGMPLRFESPGWTEFGTEGATWALHAAEDAGADNAGTRADDAEHEHAGQCRPGFSVADLDAFHQRMLTHDVPCVQEPTAVFGARVAQYRDPDGLAFSVGEG